MGTILPSQVFGAAMAAQHDGSIVNISSDAGRQGKLVDASPGLVHEADDVPASHVGLHDQSPPHLFAPDLNQRIDLYKRGCFVLESK